MSEGIKRVVIIGGGIGGLCIAIALRRIGIEAIAYEQAEQLSEAGAGITLWSNAIKALRGLGLADAVIEAGSRIVRGELRTASGRTLLRSQPGELERRFGEPTVAIHRADLHSILLSALPPEAVLLGARCQSFEQSESGVVVRFVNGHADHADLLVGADGIHSTIRKQLFPNTRLRYSGYTAWRGVVATKDESALGTTSESWGCGSRFGILRIDKERVYWFATANAPAGETEMPAKRKISLQQRFKGWHHPVELLISSTPAERILHTDIYDIEPMKRWSSGRVVLLGDAAHPTTPNMGQGGCMAIESSVVLARCLEQERDLASALSRYEAERMPRTKWITQQSWTIGRIGQLDNRLACALRDTLVGLAPGFAVNRQLERAVGFEVYD